MSQPTDTPADSAAPTRPDPVRRVELSGRRWLVDGRPQLLLGGEVHYFRLDPSDWRTRLEQLQAAGGNTLATYVPWLWHELPDGSVDLTGRTHPQRDLAGFLALAGEMGLYVIARPGPFIMAEIKNEGVPYRVYDSPGVLPTTWDGATIPTRTADYLAPAFLEAARGWYAEVMPLLASLQPSRGGPLIGVQLDNEIGMLSWVTNSPDLTDALCEDLRDWAVQRWGADEAGRRVGAPAGDLSGWAAALRTPAEDVSLTVHQTLGLYSRDRYRRYVSWLRAEAEGHGITEVPWLVNVHGTGERRGLTYPIGVSQLFESFRGQPNMTAGSDLYLGDLTVQNVPDLYVANAFMSAVQGPDQPLTSLEFEAGSGNYGEDLSSLVPPEAADLKTRLCLAQGNRLLNFYLFTGGYNPPLDEPVGDGNDRIAFTGERHGFAAPVGPEGQLNPTYGATQKALHAVRGVADLIADADQEYDGFALGFVPDHYLTEYHHPASSVRSEQVADLERFRGMGPREVLVRALVLGGYSFPAVDLQAGDIDPATVPVLVLASASTLGEDVQRRLVSYVEAGGRLLLNGLVPDRDHDGRKCTVLADGLGVRVTGREEGTPHYFPSVVPHGWAAPRPEVRTGYAQLLDAPDGEPVLTAVGSGRPTAVQVRVGEGRALVVACDYPCDLSFWHAAMASLDVRRRWVAETDGPGLLVTPTATPAGDRLLHLVHVAPWAGTVSLTDDGVPFLGGRRLRIPARTALTLPVRIDLGAATLLGSTAEVVSRSAGEVVLEPTQDEDVVVLDCDGTVSADRGEVVSDGSRHTVTVRGNRAAGRVTVRFG